MVAEASPPIANAGPDQTVAQNTAVTFYVRLLGEGVQVYRPVPALKKASNVYVIGGVDIYDPEDEEWEFLPGTHVVVEKRMLEGESVLVAIANA